MASLAGAQQLALHKPLKAAPMSRWNSMHARIAWVKTLTFRRYQFKA